MKSREIQTAVSVAFRPKEILVSFKMILKYRNKEISSLEDIQNLTAKDLREILIRYALRYGLNLHTSFGTNRSAVTFQSNCNENEDGT